MKYVVDRVIVSMDDSEREIRNKIAKRLSVSAENFRYEIIKRNLEIVEGEPVYYLKAVVDTNSFIRDTSIIFFGPSESIIIQPKRGKRRPLIVGAGLSGLFAAYVLAKAGMKPIVVEQGADFTSRDDNIAFFESGDPNGVSSYSVGLGGFSGWCGGVAFSNKLDCYGQFALDTFLECGASKRMVSDGTSYVSSGEMRQIVIRLVHEIENLGGEVILNTKMTAILTSFGKIKGIQCVKPDGKKVVYKSKSVILATGPIGPSMLSMLGKAKVKTEAKPFYLGLLAETPSKDADLAVYGPGGASNGLPPFYFSRDFKVSSGRRAKICYLYPSGRVFNDATRSSEVLLRSSFPSSNTDNYVASILLRIDPRDFDHFGDSGVFPFLHNFYSSIYRSSSPLYAPCETLKDLVGESDPMKLGKGRTSYYPGVYLQDLVSTAPAFLEKDLLEAASYFAGNFPGIKPSDAIVLGFTDGRTSPFRVVADDECNTSLKGFFSATPATHKEESILDEARRGIVCAFSLLNQD